MAYYLIKLYEKYKIENLSQILKACPKINMLEISKSEVNNIGLLLTKHLMAYL